MTELVLWIALLMLTSSCAFGDDSKPYPAATALTTSSNGAPIPYTQKLPQPTNFGIQSGYEGILIATPEQIALEEQGANEEEEIDEEAGGIFGEFVSLSEIIIKFKSQMDLFLKKIP